MVTLLIGIAIGFAIGWYCGEMRGEGKQGRESLEDWNLRAQRGEVPPQPPPGPFTKPD